MMDWEIRVGISRRRSIDCGGQDSPPKLKYFIRVVTVCIWVAESLAAREQEIRRVVREFIP
jgi:hypothetical protein